MPNRLLQDDEGLLRGVFHDFYMEDESGRSVLSAAAFRNHCFSMFIAQGTDEPTVAKHLGGIIAEVTAGEVYGAGASIEFSQADPPLDMFPHVDAFWPDEWSRSKRNAAAKRLAHTASVRIHKQ